MSVRMVNGRPVSHTDIQLARQTVALTAVAIGLSQGPAARRLGISPRTYRRSLQSAVTRLRAAGLTHAVVLAVLAGELDEARLRDRTLPDWPAWPPGEIEDQPTAVSR